MEDLNDRDGEGQFGRVIAEKMLGYRCHVVIGRLVGVTAFHAVAELGRGSLLSSSGTALCHCQFNDRYARPVTNPFLFSFYSAQAHFLLESIGDSYA